MSFNTCAVFSWICAVEIDIFSIYMYTILVQIARIFKKKEGVL